MIAIQFSSDGTLGDILIRHYTWSEIGHCDLVLPDGSLLGARPHSTKFPKVIAGVAIRQPDYVPFLVKQLYVCDGISDGQTDDVIDLCQQQIGGSYNYQADIGIPMHVDFGPAVGPPWMCSQLLAWAFDAAGYPLINQPKYNRVTPEQLRQSPLLRLQPP